MEGNRRVGAARPKTVAAAVAVIVLAAVGGTVAGLTLIPNGTQATAAPATPSPAASRSSVKSPNPNSGAAPSITTADASKLISDTCRYSHEANDDPILMPGQPGQSMAHDFFGNTSTSASSTSSQLVGGANTCSTSDDASAYWTPVLYQNGQAITPTHNLIYWSGLHATDPTVSAPPAGLEMIAGNENATSPQSTKVIGWRCASTETQIPSPDPVSCAGTNGLELRVTFPSCWNGTTLNGATQTNVVYPVRTRCPAGYPVRIPVVVFHVVYPVTSPAGLTLSMGPGMQGSTDTAHGDFINGWSQDVLARLIAGCADATHTCGHVTGATAVVHPKKV